MSMTAFNQQFDQHHIWREAVSGHLRDLAEWLGMRDLLDDATAERLQQVQEQLRSEKVTVAFVAEFSRGKSELINAVFFAGYGRRIMPASAGRTTMCPTELGWDAGVPPCLRLLPVETRLQPQSLTDWRMAPEKWTRFDLDVNDAEQLASVMEKVSETLHVPVDQARALGFWHDEQPDDNPPVNAQGLVEVPRWRHALINMAHPLLKQGLVVLDTPGLNAIGAEPELTVNLIPKAQAVVFILAADTGVTKSDQTIWREHLAPMSGGVDSTNSHFVVLNKIDTLWDALSSAERIEQQIASQCEQTALTLSLDKDQVIAVSAQKGLLAKVRGDAELLKESRLPGFEDLLGRRMLGQREAVLESALRAALGHVEATCQRVLAVRKRELAEQKQELQGLRGKNQTVIHQMRMRVDAEKGEFDRSGINVQAVRTVHMKLLREIIKLLGASSIKKELLQLSASLREPGIKFGLKKAYGEAFGNLRGIMRQVQTMEAEIDSMLAATFRQLNAEYGFTLQPPPAPDLTRFMDDMDAVERSHLQYLGMGNLFQLARPEFTEKLMRALASRVRSIFETALGDIELWNKTSFAQVDAQLRERRRAFNRRMEAIIRIEEAAGNLEQRLGEIDEQSALLDGTEKSLAARMHAIRAFSPSATAPAPTAAVPGDDPVSDSKPDMLPTLS